MTWSDLSGLCNGYCMDVNVTFMCGGQYSIQQRVVWFCEKALKIRYVILLECKGL